MDKEWKEDRRRNVWRGGRVRLEKKGVRCSEFFALNFFMWRTCALWLAVVWNVRVAKLWNGFDKSLPWTHVFWWKLPKCHRSSVSITQKHLKLVSSFYNSSLNLVRIELWKQNLRTNPNKCLLYRTHQFCVMGDENTQIQTVPQCLDKFTFPKSKISKYYAMNLHNHPVNINSTSNLHYTFLFC